MLPFLMLYSFPWVCRLVENRKYLHHHLHSGVSLSLVAKNKSVSHRLTIYFTKLIWIYFDKFIVFDINLFKCKSIFNTIKIKYRVGLCLWRRVLPHKNSVLLLLEMWFSHQVRMDCLHFDCKSHKFRQAFLNVFISFPFFFSLSNNDSNFNMLNKVDRKWHWNFMLKIQLKLLSQFLSTPYACNIKMKLNLFVSFDSVSCCDIYECMHQPSADFTFVLKKFHAIDKCQTIFIVTIHLSSLYVFRIFFLTFLPSPLSLLLSFSLSFYRTTRYSIKMKSKDKRQIFKSVSSFVFHHLYSVFYFMKYISIHIHEILLEKKKTIKIHGP